MLEDEIAILTVFVVFIGVNKKMFCMFLSYYIKI